MRQNWIKKQCGVSVQISMVTSGRARYARALEAGKDGAHETVNESLL